MTVKMTPEMTQRAIDAGLNPSTVRARLNSGWSESQAFGMPVYPQKEFVEKAKANGISDNVYYARIGRGWEPEEAATIPPGPKGPKLDRSKLAVSVAAYYHRIRNGWSPEDAASKPAKRREQPTKYINSEERKIAEANGLDMSTVNSRIRRGVPRELAITTPKGKKGVPLFKEGEKKNG